MDAHPEASHSDIVDAVKGKSRRWPRLFIAALVVGTVVRLAALTLPGTADMGVWKLWTYGGAVEAPTRLYGIGGSPTEWRVVQWERAAGTVVYPPLALYELAGVGRIYRSLNGGAFPNTDALTVAIKLLIVAMEFGLLWLIFEAVRRTAGIGAATVGCCGLLVEPLDDPGRQHARLSRPAVHASGGRCHRRSRSGVAVRERRARGGCDADQAAGRRPHPGRDAGAAGRWKSACRRSRVSLVRIGRDSRYRGDRRADRCGWRPAEPGARDVAAGASRHAVGQRHEPVVDHRVHPAGDLRRRRHGHLGRHHDADQDPGDQPCDRTGLSESARHRHRADDRALLRGPCGRHDGFEAGCCCRRSARS